MSKYCVEQNIPLYIDFRENMIYRKTGTVNDNVWEYYFLQPFVIEDIDSYDREEATFDGRGLTFQFRFDTNSEYLKEARELCKKFVKFRPELIESAQNFINEKIGCSFLSVHKRGCDHDNARDFTITEYLKETDRYIDRYEKLFVCSDEEYSVQEFKKRYGNKVVTYDTLRETDPSQSHIGIHLKENINDNIYINGRDCLIETIILSRSNLLLKTISNVTHTAVMLNENLDFVWIDEKYKTFY